MGKPSNRDRRYQIDRIIQLEAENQRLRDRIDLAENRYVELLGEYGMNRKLLLAKIQQLRGLLDFLRPELCVDCYQMLYDYEHPEEDGE